MLTWLLWLAVASAVLFVFSLLALPFLLALLPEDYLVKETIKPPMSIKRAILLVITNCFGAILFIAGVIMLFIPGQGLLTMFMGLVFMDFPQKRYWERKILCKPPVLKAVNWMREKRNKPPLIV